MELITFKPSVTIIMATYNRAHFIVETLKSIQNQTFENWECLIIDDGGTDNTFEVIKSILDTDRRFTFQKRPNTYKKGLPGCRNYGLDIAKGNYFIFFDDDDIIHPDNLKIALKVIIENNVDFCHYQKKPFLVGLPVIENEKTKILKNISRFDISEIVTNKIALASCTVLWKKECFKEIRFIEHLQYAEEWECYSRIILIGNCGVAINNILYFNRKHPKSNTGEFFLNNPIRKQSHSEAILLVIKNLQNKNLLSQSVIRYFIQISLDYKEYKLYDSIMNILNLNFIEKLKWDLLYFILPFRLIIYKYKMKFK